MVEKYTDSKQDMWKEYARTEIRGFFLGNLGTELNCSYGPFVFPEIISSDLTPFIEGIIPQESPVTTRSHGHVTVNSQSVMTPPQ